MTMNDFQRGALETAFYPAEFKAIYPTIGLSGEAGEVADKVKKILRDTAIVRDEDGSIIIDRDKAKEIAKEIGDVLWYVAVLTHDIGYTLEEVAAMNYAKLKSRQQRGMLGGSGDNR